MTTPQGTPPATRLILIRHYKTLNNAKGRILSWGNAPPADDWEQDLDFVDRRLDAAGIHIDQIYSSALERSRHTALYFAGRRGIAAVRQTADLNEVNYGALFHKTKRWVVRHVPQYKTDPDFVFPAGESFRQMQRRSVAFVNELTRNHRGETVLLVVHAGVIRGLICHYLGLDFTANLKQKVSHRYIGELILEGPRYLGYRELGRPSGFVAGGALLPATAGG